MPKKTDAALASELQRKGHLAFNWDDLDKIELPSGIVTSMYRVGDSTDEQCSAFYSSCELELVIDKT